MTYGILFIISAPSGAGKSTLIHKILHTKLLYKITVSISHTTRIIRPGERHGEHYYFVSNQEFKNMIQKEDFLEHAKVFRNYYGTARQSIENALFSGIDVLLDIDWQGAQQIRCKMPESKSIFLLPPSRDALYERLKLRGQDSTLVINERMENAIDEMSHYEEYDYLIINDDFQDAICNLKNIICSEHLRLFHQKNKYHTLISKLLNR